MNQKKFELQITVDFYDDLIPCHFTEKTFREMMRIFRDWGINRIYWIDYPYSSGWWDWSTIPEVTENARRTYEEVGEFTKAAVKYAHEQGIELFLEFKPFDLALPALVPHNFQKNSEGKGVRKGLPTLGGYCPWGCNFILEHPEYLMARNMVGVPADIHKQVIKTIRLVKIDDRPTRITKNSLQLFVSDDNQHYRRYPKPYQFLDKIEERPEVMAGINLNRLGKKKETVRVITIAGLEIKEPYLAIANTFRKESISDFWNYYYKLVELYNDKGKPIPFSYGKPELSEGWWHPAIGKTSFPNRGFMFDFSNDVTNHPGLNITETIGAIDVPGSILGLAKGKNPYLAALCPAYPEVRSYWLGLVEDYIKDGVDGVEFRFAAHQTTMDWKAYGFNQPVVDEYQRRYGIDIRNEEFDVVKWRKLRGEYYTRFYREAKALLKRHNKIMQVDIGNESYADPALPQMYNIYGDWKEWFRIADAATLKNILFDKDIYRAALKTAARYGIPTYVSSKIDFDWCRNRNETRTIDLYLKPIKEDGNQGFVLYESACIMAAKPEGTFDILVPEVPHIVAPFFKKG